MTSNPNEQPAQPTPEEAAAAQADAAGAVESTEAAATDASPAVNGDTSLADDAMTLLSEHKGKLAIGVAATLGLMVYYGWREKRLAQTDPEEYARLQRIRAGMRQSAEASRARSSRKAAARPEDEAAGNAAGAGNDVAGDTGTDASESPENR